MHSTKSALITGITGFVGKWLAEHLLQEGFRVFGFDRWAEYSNAAVEYSQLDLQDTNAVGQLLDTVRPDHVYHLAAISYLPEADLSPRHALDVNIMGTVSLLDAVKQYSPLSKVLLIGSSKEYDDALNSEQVSESIPPSPTNFYGITKYAGELIGKQYFRQFGIDVRSTRSFNHTGPGQSPRFVCSDWAKQVVEIEIGLTEPVISVGNLDAIIDFSDVRDVIRAYYQILEKGVKGDIYNVCSGRGVSLKWILETLISKSSRQITIHTEDKKLRAHKTNTVMIGDNSKLKADTQWEPAFTFNKTLEDLIKYWYDELTKKRP